jgi:hypothetical protein
LPLNGENEFGIPGIFINVGRCEMPDLSRRNAAKESRLIARGGPDHDRLALACPGFRLLLAARRHSRADRALPFNLGSLREGTMVQKLQKVQFILGLLHVCPLERSEETRPLADDLTLIALGLVARRMTIDFTNTP